ncbi:glycosyltransferase family 25 protein [Sulfitobacter sp.]|uniref:glycosyltransferase family 25 protein n=1 Tax=Sulfitobacter sp. TaxID=1903071 RepID=UPI003003462C
MKDSYPIFLINLDGSSERLSAAHAALDRHGMSFERISAFDGRKLDPLTIPEYNSAEARRYMGRDLVGGEIGCFFSHVRAAEAFVATGAPFGLVLEDDMLPQPDAFELVQKVIDWQEARNTTDWYLANLGAQRIKITTAVATLLGSNGSATICRAHYFPMLTTALLWSREGAIAFLAAWQPIVCPIDNYARKWLIQSDMGIAVVPSPFTSSGAQSDIAPTGPTASRNLTGRTHSYQWRRNIRLIGAKLKALGHKRKFASRGPEEEK